MSVSISGSLRTSTARETMVACENGELMFAPAAIGQDL